MKTQFKKIAVVLAVVVMVLAFAACGSAKYADSPYLGTWSATNAEYLGIEMSIESVIGGEFEVTLDETGKCEVSMAGETSSGSWTETETGFNVEDEFDFTVDGDLAVLDYSGVTMNFERK